MVSGGVWGYILRAIREEDWPCSRLGSNSIGGIHMDKLIKMAIDAREKAVAKLTGFKVGAALETLDGKIYTGANFESEVCSLSNCAERVVIGYAITNGERKFKRLAIVGSTKEPCPPCGVCRQFLIEFAPDVEIIMATQDGANIEKFRPADLLPHAYRLPNEDDRP